MHATSLGACISEGGVDLVEFTHKKVVETQGRGNGSACVFTAAAFTAPVHLCKIVNEVEGAAAAAGGGGGGGVVYARLKVLRFDFLDTQHTSCNDITSASRSRSCCMIAGSL